jgi:hypothetical protein
MPRIVTQLLMRLAAPRSPLLRKMLASDNEYLHSISTYMFKLSADHLPLGFDGPVDRKVAAAPPVALVRLRMQQIAQAPLTEIITFVEDLLRPWAKSDRCTKVSRTCAPWHARA